LYLSVSVDNWTIVSHRISADQ